MSQVELKATVGSELDQALTVFLAERTRLFSIAYRIVGSVPSAEDVVQEVWLRWQRADRDEIDNPAAFLVTATKRLAINLIQSAGHRHEVLIGVPVTGPADGPADPTTQAEQAAAVEWVLGLMTTRLTPAERAVYLLRKGFDYPYQEIAQVLRTTAPNARQLARRAQQNLATGRSGHVSPELCRRLVQAFLNAARTGELADLERLLVTSLPPARSTEHPTIPRFKGHHREQAPFGSRGSGHRRRNRKSPVPVPAGA